MVTHVPQLETDSDFDFFLNQGIFVTRLLNQARLQHFYCSQVLAENKFMKKGIFLKKVYSVHKFMVFLGEKMIRVYNKKFLGLQKFMNAKQEDNLHKIETLLFLTARQIKT